MKQSATVFSRSLISLANSNAHRFTILLLLTSVRCWPWNTQVDIQTNVYQSLRASNYAPKLNDNLESFKEFATEVETQGEAKAKTSTKTGTIS